MPHPTESKIAEVIKDTIYKRGLFKSHVFEKANLSSQTFYDVINARHYMFSSLLRILDVLGFEIIIQKKK
jgi:predicted transcriptional regulator